MGQQNQSGSRQEEHYTLKLGKPKKGYIKALGTGTKVCRQGIGKPPG